MHKGKADNIEFSIVMPCLNESETVGVCVAKAAKTLRNFNIKGEIVVADNGSNDNSSVIAEKQGARVVRIETKGYGSALMGGISTACGQYIIMGDADDSYDFSNVQLFIEKLREGYDLVMGNRFKGEIKPGAMPFLHRYLGNPILSWLGRLFFGSPVGDFHCGLRGFSRERIIALKLCSSGMEFASEMVVKATVQGLRITEVPTTLYPDGRSRASHLRTWRDGWRHLRFLLLYSPRWLFLYPGLLLMGVGSLVSFSLVNGPRTVGSVTFDVHTLIYSTVAISIGFQAVAFSVFAKVFAMHEGLLPFDARIDKFLRFFPLEAGLIIGGILCLTGFVGSVYALGVWETHAFGALDVSKTLRVVVPSATAMLLGCQIFFSSFFLSMLGLKNK